MAKQDKKDRTVHVSIRLPEGLVDWIDEQAAEERWIRTQMIRILIEDARKAREDRGDLLPSR